MNTKESGHLKKSKLLYQKKDATNQIDKFVVVKNKKKKVVGRLLIRKTGRFPKTLYF